MSDRRVEILQQNWTKRSSSYKHASREESDWQLDAMDEYLREKTFELLEYMAKKKVICMDLGKEGIKFLTKGESLTKEQLFERFSLQCHDVAPGEVRESSPLVG